MIVQCNCHYYLCCTFHIDILQIQSAMNKEKKSMSTLHIYRFVPAIFNVKKA